MSLRGFAQNTVFLHLSLTRNRAEPRATLQPNAKGQVKVRGSTVSVQLLRRGWLLLGSGKRLKLPTARTVACNPVPTSDYIATQQPCATAAQHETPIVATRFMSTYLLRA